MASALCTGEKVEHDRLKMELEVHTKRVEQMLNQLREDQKSVRFVQR